MIARLLLMSCLGCTNKPSVTDTSSVDTSSVDTSSVDTGLLGSGLCGELLCEDEICWMQICGGSYEMGARAEVAADDELPRHTVNIRSFSLMSTEVRISTHDRCVAEGACQPILPDGPINCTDQGPDDPRGCLDWHMANEVCEWLGGRLPSESEWEYAARSEGIDTFYPWGEQEPDCSLAVLGYTGIDNCGESGPAAVCSRPSRLTAQGLCDMAGNLFEWVADWYHDTYDGAPDDGSVWDDRVNAFKLLRGGGIGSDEPVSTWNRAFHEPEFSYSGMGVRCARD